MFSIMAAASDTDIDVTLENDEQLTKGLDIQKIIERIHGNGAEILNIGIISHARTTPIKRELISKAGAQQGCNWVISLYVTDDHTTIHTVYGDARRSVKDVTEKTPRHSVTGGCEEQKERHRVVAFLRHNVTYEPKDHIKTNLHDIREKINRLLGNNPESDFYIGIGSGPDATFAMKRRCQGDDYKILHGINRMIALFKSDRQDSCRNKEKDLIEHYKASKKYSARYLNQTGGGGGRDTQQPWSFVYLGLQRRS